jgi:predicted phage replisome organizer
MPDTKKIHWLKLQTDFFNNKFVKELRKMKNGDKLTIIYLKLLLLSIKNNGVIKFDGTENNLPEQLELELDENVEDIRKTLVMLLKQDLIESVDENTFIIKQMIQNKEK